MQKKLLKPLGLLLMALALQAQASDSKTLVVSTVVKHPENLVRTTTGRTFMSAESGIFEVLTSSTGKILQPLNLVYRTAINGKVPAPNTPCYFAGMAQRGNHVIAACAVNFNDATTPRYIMSLDLADPSATVREVAKLSNVGMSNGMTVDPAGRVYLADSGALLLPGKILRLNFKGADPMLGFTQQTWLSRFGHPNGVKATASALYWTENPLFYSGPGAKVYRASITSSGAAGTATAIYSANCCFDDLALVKDGIILADFTAKRLTHLSEQGTVLHTTTTSIATPSSVLFDSSSVAPWSTLWVTEYDSGTLVAVQQDWALQPR